VAIENNLKELDRWYNEILGESERPKFLSKLATLELCGWLENRMDSIVYKVGELVGLEDTWIRKNVIDSVNGFDYEKHLRKMLSKIVGESGVVHLEACFEQSCPGKLDELKGAVSALWTTRCSLAHTHVGASSGKQEQVNAPSWSSNQQRVLGKILDQFEDAIPRAFTRSISP
jgi:hypothetical protein